MRYLCLIFCLWSSVSLFTYTEILPPNDNHDISSQILQIIENYADIWPDEAIL